MLNNESMRCVKRQDAVGFGVRIPRLNHNHVFVSHKNTAKTQELIPSG